MSRFTTIWRIVLIFSASIGFYSCGSIPPDISGGDLDRNIAGTEYSESHYMHKEPITTLEFVNLNDTTNVYVYKKIEWERPGAFFGFGTNTMYDVCAAVFKNNKLYFWGYVDDFKKEQDPFIQMIGENISDKLINGDL